GLRGRGPPRYVSRPEWSWRSRRDLYWRPKPQSPCRHGAWQRPQAFTDPQRYAHGRRRRAHDWRSARAGRPSRDRVADRRANVRRARRTVVTTRSRGNVDGTQAESRSGIDRLPIVDG